MSGNDSKTQKKEYNFGEIKEYDLEKIEAEVLQESVYLDVFAGSDLAFKEDCIKLSSEEVFNKVSLLNAYSFKYKTESFPGHSFPEGTQIGFMAQEIESIFPHLVKKDEAGNRFVNYTQVIPLMTETIKHLTNRLDQLEQKFDQHLKK
jgi:Chaperone of endosialidase